MKAEPFSESEDERILQVARVLCQQFDLKKVYPGRLSWSSGYSRWVEATTHYPLLYRHTLFLRPVMRGRLGVEEWKPLLAASIIFHGQFWSKVNRRTALGLAPMLVILTTASLLWGLHNSLFIQTIPSLTLVALILVSLVAAFVQVLLVRRKFRLLADRRAAGQIGTQSFIEVLLRIQSLKQSDTQQDKRLKWAWTEPGDAPSIEKRIKNLHRP